MSIREVSLALLVATLLVSGCACAESHRASSPVCTPAQADAADAMVDTLDGWTAVDAFYKAYRQCDDGDIAEGSAEAIARLLADRWETLPQLQGLVRREPALRAFVMRHINTTLATDDLDKIARNAAMSCPRGAADLCKAIQSAAEQAGK